MKNKWIHRVIENVELYHNSNYFSEYMILYGDEEIKNIIAITVTKSSFWESEHESAFIGVSLLR